ncbi:MAG: ribonuclease P protein component [Legionella sp.]|nr:MAG: ribonuclease P protein component [Legionella sp.]
MNEFSQSRRLLKKTDYDHVFHQAKKMVSPHFIFLYRDNAIDHARLGLALSKKVIAKAHDRSRIKRLIRETFRVTHRLPAMDVIVLARSGVAKAQNSELIEGLQRIWSTL